MTADRRNVGSDVTLYPPSHDPRSLWDRVALDRRASGWQRPATGDGKVESHFRKQPEEYRDIQSEPNGTFGLRIRSARQPFRLSWRVGRQ